MSADSVVDLKEKLARWVGFEFKKRTRSYMTGPHSGGTEVVEDWYSPQDSCIVSRLPDFTESLDACFKWLVPKLPANMRVGLSKMGDNPYYYARIEGYYFDSSQWVATDETPALALCRAIEQLVDNE